MIQVSSTLAATKERLAILQFTEELFGQRPTIEAEADPELANSDYLVVRVATSAPVADIVRLNDAWHRKLREVSADNASLFRLALDIT